MKNKILWCPSCGKLLEAPVQYSGTQAVCSKCKEIILVPDFNSAEYQEQVKLHTHADPHVFTAFVRCLDFSGRAPRKEYCLFCFLYIAIEMLLGSSQFVLCLLLPRYAALLTTIFTLFTCFWRVVTLLPAIALIVRRLHDIGNSGIWILAMCVPIFNIYMSINFIFKKSQPQTNQWGPCHE